MDCYLGVTRKKKCWEGRGLTSEERNLIALGQDRHVKVIRDFTAYLNAWGSLSQRLRRR